MPFRGKSCTVAVLTAGVWRFWGTKNGGKHRSVGELLQGGSLICQGISKSMMAKNKGFPGHHFGNERIWIEIHRPFQAGEVSRFVRPTEKFS